MTSPRHRKNAVVKTRPLLQLAGRHEGPSPESKADRGEAAIRIPQWNDTEFRDLLHDMTVGNPFKAGASA